MYQLPQEIEVWYIIPAIRKELAKQLTKTHGLSYEKTGNILGITKAAVSQYISNKRANKVCISKEIKKEIKDSAKILSKEPKQAVSEMQRLLKIMKDKKCSCNVCKKFNKNIIEYCNCEPKY